MCMSVCCMYLCAPWSSEDGVRSPGNEAMDYCEQQCGFWGPNQGSLQEQ